jgi:hypothetical protein
MLIAFESLPGNDPRIDREIRTITVWWHYTIAEVPDSKYIDWLYPVQLTEAESKADVICSAVNDEITVLKSEAKRGNLIGYSNDDEEANNKIVHVLSNEEKAVAVSFLKKILINFSEKNLSSIKEVSWIKQEITKCRSLNELHMIMAQHFDYASSLEGQLIPTPAQNLTSWKNPEIVSLPPKNQTA